ncbi:MAG: hypothetical protein PW788_02505 [Micavibrio sp.]|nr:hypothetical protein [Micavibrio sp.]
MPLQPEFNENADEWFALEDGSFPAVPRALAAGVIAVRGTVDLPIADSTAFRTHEDSVKAALLILSQSPAARQLATVAINAGYSIHVTAPKTGDGDVETFAQADHENRRIKLQVSGSEGAEKLALNIIHELVHVSQITRGGLGVDTRHGTPEASLRQILAMEADARARTIHIALELAYRGSAEPDERLTLPNIVMLAAEAAGVPMTLGLVQRAAPHLPDGIAPDALLATLFKSFYTSLPLRQHYGLSVLNAIESAGIADIQNTALFTGGKTANDVVTALDGHMQPAYLAPRVPGMIDLDSAALNAVSPTTATRLAQLAQLRGTHNEAGWAMPAYTITAAPKPNGPKP